MCEYCVPDEQLRMKPSARRINLLAEMAKRRNTTEEALIARANVWALSRSGNTDAKLAALKWL